MCYIRSLRSLGFKLVSRQGLEWLECAKISRMSWLVHAFGTRRGGVSKIPATGLNLGLSQSDLPARGNESRRLFLKALGVERFHLASLHQIHSAQIWQVVQGTTGTLEYRPAGLPASRKHAHSPEQREPSCAGAGDALLTDRAGVLLSVRSADCVPVLLADPKRRAVAAVHAGWRGALEGCLEKTVGEMRRVFGSHPRDLVAAIGPSIRVCCYEVGEEIWDKFRSRFTGSEQFFRGAASPSIGERHPLLFPTGQPPGRTQVNQPTVHLDLVAVSRAQLRSAGVPRTNVEVAEFCTACRTDLFFSHRKEKGPTGRMMSVIGIRP
jgi:purine-nucleoside/S-methyl-5'-thioadenosine phosphorylase / adenosine deaminase